MFVPESERRLTSKLFEVFQAA